MGNNILLDYLREHASEILNMLDTEWNWDDALAVSKEEGFEKGRALERISTSQEIFSLLKQGFTLEEVEAKFMQKN